MSDRPPRMLGPIESAVVHDLAGIDEALARSPLAASAIHLARVQDATVSARDVATIARELRATWDQLTRGVDATEGGDEVDEFTRRREARNPGPSSEVGT